MTLRTAGIIVLAISVLTFIIGMAMPDLSRWQQGLFWVGALYATIGLSMVVSAAVNV